MILLPACWTRWVSGPRTAAILGKVGGMKRAILAILFLALACVASAQGGFRITDFGVQLKLDKDGTLHVQETIATTFDEQHHGIFRDIPIHYETGKGVSRSLILDSISVTDERGNSRASKVTHEGQNLHIRIGSPDSYEPVGSPVIYVISYKSFGHMNWFDDDRAWQPYAELYWNLTGDQWPVPIDKVHFTLDYPEVGTKDVRARLFVGPYGSRNFQEVDGAKSAEDQNLQTKLNLTTHLLNGEVDRELGAYEGTTLVVDLPSKTIDKPTFLQAAGLFLKANLGFTLPIFALVAMFTFWAMFGKDPGKKPIAVQFEPPDGMTGPEVGTLLDERVDQRDLAAGVISLAVKGYVVIHPEETGLVFKKRTATIEIKKDTPGEELTDFERSLLTHLAAGGPMVDDVGLRTYVAPHLSELKSSLYSTMVARGYYIADPESVRTMWMVGGVLVAGGLAVLTHFLSPTKEIVPSVVGGVLSAIIVIAFAMLMPRRTSQGADAQRKVAGFQEFIRRARGKELDWQSKKDPSAQLFEEYLPHAVAFGLTREWAQAFEGIVLAMPNWYAAPYGTPFYPGYFASDMVTITDGFGSAASTPPRSSGSSGGSSGFGGGGFSGGGFGGGGGGSW